MDDTRSYTSNCDSFVISKILTNSDSLFADIPQKIKDIIDSHNVTDALKELPIWLAENVSHLDKLTTYCLHNIDRTIRHKLWDTEFKAYFEFIAAVNPSVQFTYNDNLQ